MTGQPEGHVDQVANLHPEDYPTERKAAPRPAPRMVKVYGTDAEGRVIGYGWKRVTR